MANYKYDAQELKKTPITDILEVDPKFCNNF